MSHPRPLRWLAFLLLPIAAPFIGMILLGKWLGRKLDR